MLKEKSYNNIIYDFMDECKKKQISIISYSKDELENELKLMSGL